MRFLLDLDTIADILIHVLVASFHNLLIVLRDYSNIYIAGWFNSFAYSFASSLLSPTLEFTLGLYMLALSIIQDYFTLHHRSNFLF